MQVHSSAPTRLDLAGGTLDIWPLYLFHDGAQTLNVALALRAECEVRSRTDGCWHIASEDTGAELTLTTLSDGESDPKHRLVLRLLQFFRPDPVTVITRSRSPLGAGIAGSSALNVALCAALARYTNYNHTPEALMTIALNLEARVIGVPTGAQDYRPAMYGGIAAIEMGPAGVTRHALDVPLADLQSRLVLAYTGQPRDSGINNWDITKRHIDGDRVVIDLCGEIADVARTMRLALEMRDWNAVAEQIRREWDLRKRLAPGVTTSVIDRLITRAHLAGARAAKVCGAGGGGCVLFIAEPDELPVVRRAIADDGATILDAELDPEGLRVTASEFDG